MEASRLVPDFLRENGGKPSSTRLVMVGWGFGVLVVWAIESLSSFDGKMAEINESVLVALALVLGGKVVQKSREPVVDKIKDTQ